MRTWIYFAANSMADLRSTISLAAENHVILRSARNSTGAFIANVKAVQPGDEIYLACRGKKQHIALKGTVGEPINAVQGTNALDQLHPEYDADAIELIQLLYGVTQEPTAIRLVDVEPCHIDLGETTYPQNAIQAFPDFLNGQDAKNTPEADPNDLLVLTNVFPYIGEYVLQEGMNQSLEALSKFLGCSAIRRVHRQSKLGFDVAGVWFDGSGTLDLAVELLDDSVLPIEVKLGFTGLGPASVNRILRDCELSSHTDKLRVAGKVPAALNGNFGASLREKIGEERLKTWIDGQWRPVRTDWRMIARDRFIESWDTNRPNFSDSFKPVSLEGLCGVIGADCFNSVVKELLQKRDFYDLWIGN